MEGFFLYIFTPVKTKFPPPFFLFVKSTMVQKIGSLSKYVEIRYVNWCLFVSVRSFPLSPVEKLVDNVENSMSATVISRNFPVYTPILWITSLGFSTSRNRFATVLRKQTQK